MHSQWASESHSGDKGIASLVTSIKIRTVVRKWLVGINMFLFKIFQWELPVFGSFHHLTGYEVFQHIIFFFERKLRLFSRNVEI